MTSRVVGRVIVGRNNTIAILEVDDQVNDTLETFGVQAFFEPMLTANVQLGVYDIYASCVRSVYHLDSWEHRLVEQETVDLINCKILQDI